MKYKKLVIICSIVCIIFGISSVCANEVNNTITTQNEQQINDIMLIDTVTDAVSNSEGTFSDLKNEIENTNTELKLTKNYTYTDNDAELINGILIKKQITIDGNGFTINGNMKSRAFDIQSTVILKNIHFENCRADTGGAIIFKNVKDGEIINSTFSNNYADSFGGCIYARSSSLKIQNTSFIENSARREGGSIYSYDTIFVFNFCNFTSNKAKIFGATMQFESSSGVIENCNFRSNTLTNMVQNVHWEEQYIQEGCLINCDIDNSDIKEAIGGKLRNITKLEVIITNHIVNITVINPNFFNGEGYFLDIEKYPFPTSHNSFSTKYSLKLYNNNVITDIDYVSIGLNQYRVYYNNFINEYYYYFNITQMVQSSISVESITAQRGTSSMLKIKIDTKSNSYDDIKKGYVELSIDGKSYNVPVIEGQSEISITLPKEAGTFNYNVKFIPYSKYIYSSSTNLNIISKYGTKVTVKSVKGYQRKKVKLTATVKDDTGKIIKKGKVTFQVNGKTYTAKVTNGKAKITIKYPKAHWYEDKSKHKGKYRYETSYYQSTYISSVKFNGYGQYMSSSSLFKVTSKGKTIKHKYRMYTYRTFTLPVKNTLKFYKKEYVIMAVGMKHLTSKNKLVIGVGDSDDHPIKFKVKKHYKKNGKRRWSNWFYCDEDHYVETTYGNAIKIDKVKINCYSPYFVKIY